MVLHYVFTLDVQHHSKLTPSFCTTEDSVAEGGTRFCTLCKISLVMQMKTAWKVNTSKQFRNGFCIKGMIFKA